MARLGSGISVRWSMICRRISSARDKREGILGLDMGLQRLKH